MAECDRAAVDVHLGRVLAQIVLGRAGRRCERLVCLGQVKRCHVLPAFCSALRLIRIGPLLITAGSTPAVAHDPIRGSSAAARLLAFAALITTATTALSLRLEKSPAVIVLFLPKASRSLASTSADASGFGCSSTGGLARRVLTGTGGQYLAQDHLVALFRTNARPIQSGANRDHPYWSCRPEQATRAQVLSDRSSILG